MNKQLSTILFIFIFQVPIICFGQNKIARTYRNSFGEKLEFLNDSTFMHTWSFDLAASWTKGKWGISNDTIYLKSIIIKDTLTIRNSENEILKDSLVLSTDKKSNRIENEEFVLSLISGGGQNRKLPPKKLYLKNGKLYRLLENGKIDKTKSKTLLTGKKYKTYFKPKDR